MDSLIDMLPCKHIKYIFTSSRSGEKRYAHGIGGYPGLCLLDVLDLPTPSLPFSNGNFSHNSYYVIDLNGIKRGYLTGLSNFSTQYDAALDNNLGPNHRSDYTGVLSNNLRDEGARFNMGYIVLDKKGNIVVCYFSNSSLGEAVISTRIMRNKINIIQYINSKLYKFKRDSELGFSWIVSEETIKNDEKRLEEILSSFGFSFNKIRKSPNVNNEVYKIDLAGFC